jgi:hypothetical protein
MNGMEVRELEAHMVEVDGFVRDKGQGLKDNVRMAVLRFGLHQLIIYMYLFTNITHLNRHSYQLPRQREPYLELLE